MNKTIIAFLILIFAISCVPQEKHAAFETSENPSALAVKGEGEWWLERHQTILKRLASDP